MVENQTNCKNCKQGLIDDAKYCFACGQSVNSFNEPVKSVIFDAFHETLDIDGRLLKTLRALLFKPGLLTREFNLGKRVSYTPPLRMYLVISIIFFLVASQYLQTEGMYSFVPKIMFMLLPVLAFLLQVMFRTTYYIPNLIYTLHLHCFLYLYLTIIFLLPLSLFDFSASPQYIILMVNIPIFSLIAIYIVKSIKINYDQNWFKTIWKSLVLISIYVLIISISMETLNDLLAK
jgi:hypothetical protein